MALSSASFASPSTMNSGDDKVGAGIERPVEVVEV
jgi:hypothetical protein